MRIRRQNTEAQPLFQELPVPPGRRYVRKSDSSIWMPLYILATEEGDLVTAFEIPQSERWTHRVCEFTGAAMIFPEAEPLVMDLNMFLNEFILIHHDPDFDFFAEDFR